MDFPAFLGVAVDTSRGPHRGTIYGVWTDHAQGTANPDPVRTVFEVEPNDGPGNATPIQIGDDIFGVLSGTEYENDCDLFTFDGTAGSTIQITGGATACPPGGGCREIPFSFRLLCGETPAELTQVGCGSVYDPGPIPPAIYTLPTTGRYYLDFDCGAVSYQFSLREYVLDPASVARDHRDVVLVRSTDGGATWSGKVRVNDDAPMYDNSIPAVTVDGSGRVHVAWYDRREEPACGARVHTYWTYSEDGGVTFQPSRRVSDQPSEGGRRYIGPGQVNTWQVGDHLALSADGDLVYLLWTQISIGGGDGEILGVAIGDPPVASVVSAEAEPTGVRIVWQVNGVGSFTVYRRNEGGEWAPLAQRTPDEADQIVLADDSVVQGTRYAYRLGVVVDGQEVLLGEVEIEVPRVPGGINLSWDDCGTAGSGLKSFACDSNTGPAFTAVASFVPPPGIGQFTGANAELLIGTDAATLPDWWQHGPGLCRAGTGLAVAYSFAEGPFTCAEAGGGLAAGMHSYEVGYAGVNRARLQVQYVVPTEPVGALDPSTEYYAFRVNLLRGKTTGVGACAGCGEPMCLQLESIQLFQTPGAQYDPVLITPLGRNFVSWQGRAWTCDVATPVLGSLVSAEASTDEVRVVWEAQAPEAAVYRREGAGDWVRRTRLMPDGLGRVEYVDRDVRPGFTYAYRLGLFDVGGAEIFVGETSLTVPERAMTLGFAALSWGEGGLRATITLPAAERALLEVFDLGGRRMVGRRIEGLDAGEHRLELSASLRPGVYFGRLTQGRAAVNRRFVVAE